MILAALFAAFYQVAAFGQTPAPSAAPGALPLIPRQETKDDAQLAFRVTKPDASPLAGVRFQVLLEGPGNEAKRQKGSTDREGRIDFIVPNGTRVTWTAQAPDADGREGLGELKTGKWTAPLDRDAAEIDVVLRTEDNATFAARFVDSATKRPLSGVRVQRLPDEGALPWRMVAKPPTAGSATITATANKDGVVRVPAATWRTHHLLVFADGYAHSLLTIGGQAEAPGLQEVLEVPLQQEATLQITLLDGTEDMWVSATASISAPTLKEDSFEGAFRRQVTFQSQPTGEEGIHLIRGLAARSQVSLTLMEGKTPGRDLDNIKCGDPGSESRLIFDCWKRGVIGGMLHVQADASPAGRSVHLFRQKQGRDLRVIYRDKPLAKTRTDPNGGFRFKGLAIGDYYAFVLPQTAPPDLPDQVTQPVTVKLTPESPRVDIDIQEVTGGYLSGILTDSQGAPSQTTVTADCKYQRLTVPSGAKGTFRVGPFHPQDDVRLWAMPPQGKWSECRTDTNRLTAPMEGIELALNPAGKLDLIVVGVPSKVRAWNVEVELSGPARSYSFGGGVQADGSFSSGGITPGKYTLTVSLGASRKSTPLEVEILPGKVTDRIKVELPPR